MPRLLGESAVDAYPERSYYVKYIKMGLSTLAIFWLFHNIMLKDYRSEEINMLRNHGFSQTDIDAYIPQTINEKVSEKNSAMKEYEQLKEDVATLKKDMDRIKEKIEMRKKDETVIKKKEEEAVDEVKKES